MTRTATVITAIIVILIVAGGIWLFMQPALPGGSAQNPGTVSTEDDTAIRAAVSGFGNELKNVSLLSTSTIAEDMGTHYGPYLSADLLAHWEADPSEALGRETSSPWPDHIDITSVQDNGDGTFTVDGAVVEATSAPASTTPMTYPVTLTVEKQDAVWVITDAERTPQ